MPPVADQESRAWGDAIDGLLEANEKAGKTPDSLRGLARALGEQPGSTQSEKSWLSTLKRTRKGTQKPRDPVAHQIARALRVDRATLPDSAPMTAQDVSDRLEAELAGVVRYEDVPALLDPLRASLEGTREAIRLLANGDTQGALRVLSAAAGEK